VTTHIGSRIVKGEEAVKDLRFQFGTSSLRSQFATSRSLRLSAGEPRVSVLNGKTKP